MYLGEMEKATPYPYVFHFLCFLQFDIIQTQNWSTNNVNRKLHRNLQNWNQKPG